MIVDLKLVLEGSSDINLRAHTIHSGAELGIKIVSVYEKGSNPED